MTTPADASYRRRLLGLLGDRPPLESLAETAERIAAEAARLGPEGLPRSWGEGQWTGAQILAHLADVEIGNGFRFRQILAQDDHVIQPFDESAWMRAHLSIDAAAALASFRATRAWNLALLRQLTPEQLARPAVHPERGAETLDGIVRMLAGHDWNHLGQLAQIGGGRAASGRPGPGEYADYAQADIDLVRGDDILAALARQREQVLSLLRPVDPRRAASFVYAPGKWTVNQVVGHLSDDERIFAYRLLCVARGDERPLPGFEEKDYAQASGHDARALGDLLDEYATVREATLVLLRGLPASAWGRRGTVNGYRASVRGLAFHIAGHELHHVEILRSRYL